MIDYSEIIRSTISHKAVIEQVDRDIRDNEIKIQEEQKKANFLIKDNKVRKFSYEYLDKLVKDESGKFIKTLNEMLNFAIKTIFYDRDYNIEIRTEENKTSIRLKYTDDYGNPVDADIKNCGGGLRTVVATILNIHFIFLYKLEPIYFVDEGLSAVSEGYLERLLALLDELAKKNDLKILLITHDKRFIEYEGSVNKYEVRDGIIKRIETEKESVVNPS